MSVTSLYRRVRSQADVAWFEGGVQETRGVGEIASDVDSPEQRTLVGTLPASRSRHSLGTFSTHAPET